MGSPERCRYWHHDGWGWHKCRALVSSHTGHHAEWHKQNNDITEAPTITRERTV